MCAAKMIEASYILHEASPHSWVRHSNPWDLPQRNYWSFISSRFNKAEKFFR